MWGLVGENCTLQTLALVSMQATLARCLRFHSLTVPSSLPLTKLVGSTCSRAQPRAVKGQESDARVSDAYYLFFLLVAAEAFARMEWNLGV